MKTLQNSLFMMRSRHSRRRPGLCVRLYGDEDESPGRKLFKLIQPLAALLHALHGRLSYIMMFGKNGLITRAFCTQKSIFSAGTGCGSRRPSRFPCGLPRHGGVLQSISRCSNTRGAISRDGLHAVPDHHLSAREAGVAGAALLVAIQVLADFGNPIIISGSFPVSRPRPECASRVGPTSAGAAILSILLLLPSFGIFLLQRYWVAGAPM